jgi:D-alanyl-lipoteichoic acid acyltransferase DltB (MBOAT superfamily)
MAFHTLNYAIFFAAALIVAWALARRNMLRLTVLLVASWFFYMNSMLGVEDDFYRLIVSGTDWLGLPAPPPGAHYILLILFSTVVDYFCGHGISIAQSPLKKKLLLSISLVSNLGLLGLFKYYNFFVESMQLGLANAGLPALPLNLLNTALPVGISFYTFQTMAYSIDIYRGHQKPIRNFVKFALFVSFFPQLVAGPIVLAKELVPQLETRARLTSAQVSDGVWLIMKGLIKKLAIADFLALNLIDRVYDKPEVFTSGEVMLALFAYSMQIYCDFSGYTDMAIGSAKLFGYELPENFDRPYQAESVARFWRRWHMTLSRWVREYIYFPLGGTHKGEARAYFNIMAALVIMGLWHGANWTFFWYGVIHGAMVGINRYHNQKRKRLGLEYSLTGWRWAWRVAAALSFVTLARILFRSQNLDQAWAVTAQLLHPVLAIDVSSPWQQLTQLGVGGLFSAGGLQAIGTWLAPLGTVFWYSSVILMASVVITLLPFVQIRFLMRLFSKGGEKDGDRALWMKASGWALLASLLLLGLAAPAWSDLEGLFTFGHLHWKIWLVLCLSYAIHWTPRSWVTSSGLSFRRLPGVVQGAILAVVLAWMVHLSNTQPVPFIYFQF